MTEIKVTAPDWDLGELERGKETTRTFATDAQRLCFSYDPKYIDYDKYLISASNRNGVAGNRFQLAGLTDPGERVPYAESGGRRRPCGVAQRGWAVADAGQERHDVPDAHVQGMGRRGCQEGISAMCLRSPLSPSLRRGPGGRVVPRADARGGQDGTVPMSVAIGYGVLVRHMPPVAKQTTGWTHRREGREMVLENTGNVRVVLLDARVGTSAEPRSLALFPGVPQRIADGGLRWNDGGASRSLSCL